jgi:phospho-N-acetylmuramoyl-pentapeptide-transferase
MLYYLFSYLDKHFDLPGTGLFQYISFRAGAAVIISLTISLIFGKKLINYLKKKQVKESVRDLGLDGQKAKEGTPTMGGLIILAAILIPVILFARLDNIYIILILFTTIWLGFIGFVDDYIKVFRHEKKGLAARFKLAGQVVLGIVVGITLFFSDAVVLREKVPAKQQEIAELQSTTWR